ncbi:Type IV fimbrial assembly, ATPase PilB [hydrothermal vent metagenome]|uniref:Type IV fimbrial assembly, ATPase PilB n=1 Tax=hydrothermal vent metagenome TaxID=652676 RepID=A0A3B1CZJ3_9ZZZZ
MDVRGKTKLGDFLIKNGVITSRERDKALLEQGRTGARLGSVLASLGYVTDDTVVDTLSCQLGIAVADFSSASPATELLHLAPEPFARKHSLCPIGVDDVSGAVIVAMADPLDLFVMDELSARFPSAILPRISTEKRIRNAIDHYYGILVSDEALSKDDKNSTSVSIAQKADKSSAPVARLVESIITSGVEERASDIHIEPTSGGLLMRYRVDGVMVLAQAPQGRHAQAVISRIKIMAKLDIAESRVPQDGGFELSVSGRRMEFRVSTFPTIYGESVVIRILSGGDVRLGMGELGLLGTTLRDFKKAICGRAGILIVTGPTGSGKTTTLYSALSEISAREKVIVTIEDPVEYRLEYVRQTQVNPKGGITFSRGLRSILRQDPDIIMVGEVRDPETAAIATQAAMTGHLVLTTLHTDNAASAVTRMLDLGVEPYKIASTFVGALAQRLVRRVCEKCHGGNGITECRHCRHSGYHGRVGIFEFLSPDDGMRELIMSRSPSSVLMRHARDKMGMSTMREDGTEKAKRGITTTNEINRITPED